MVHFIEPHYYLNRIIEDQISTKKPNELLQIDLILTASISIKIF